MMSKSSSKSTSGKETFQHPNKDRSASREPRSINELEKWISDYLYHFCSNVLDEVLQKENTTKEQLSATWYLTTPGSWSDPTRLDFKMLARKVLVDLLPGVKSLQIL
jgi:hypothetical protein